MAVISGRGVGTGRAGTDLASGRNNADVSQREDLANFISMITRDETPFMSSIGKTKATAIYHEWQTDSLDAPGDSKISEGVDYVLPGNIGLGTSGGAGNAQSVGDDFAVVGPNRSRLGNYTQINGKTISVSGTRRAIDQAGVADEYAYQLKKRGTELRRDLEHDLIHKYQTSNGGTQTGNIGTAARTMGGYQAWINWAGGTAAGDFVGGQTSSGIVELNGATAAANEGVGTDAPTLTAARVSLSLSDIDAIMQRIYEEGGKASKIMVSPKLRRDFSDLMVTDSGVRRNIDMDGKLRQSVDIYMSDFGDLMVVPNYIMGLSYGQGGSCCYYC